MPESYPYLPGRQLDPYGLLARFLPPVPEDLISTWLSKHSAGSNLIFDPFGSSPSLALQIARNGYKVLTCVNNPILRFLINLGATPPTLEDYRAALAEFARSRIGDDRLEIHLANLYQTRCLQCGNVVNAEAFIWVRDANSPQSKIYECMHCGDSGEHPVSEQDIELSRSFPATPMHRMRIIERISPKDDKVRKNLLDALSVYQPRAMYALVTLVNRLESLMATSKQDAQGVIKQNCLIALVLFALDYGNNLWTYPSGRARPKQLTSSPLFRENNLWFILEKAATQLPTHHDPVSISPYPDLNNGGARISIYNGPLRNLCDEIGSHSKYSSLNIDAVVTAIPRHNQAFWTLSALWAGWIWGKETLGEFQSVLLRRRYDWSWHCGALNKAFSSIGKILTRHTPVLGLIPESEPGFIQSTTIAADQANFSLNGISLRADEHFTQLHWDYPKQPGKQISAPIIYEDTLHKALVSRGIEFIEKRGEPAPYITIYTKTLFNIVQDGGISNNKMISSGDEYSRIQLLIENSLTYKNGFIRQGGSERALENAIYWHQNIKNPSEILSDRIESTIRNIIKDQPGIDKFNLDQLICNKFPGLSTPDSGLIEQCISSYCNKKSLVSGLLILREQDDPDKRRLEIASNCIALQELGSKLGYEAIAGNPVIWNAAHSIAYAFFIISSAEIGNIVLNNKYPNNNSVLVLPGARSNLLLSKITKNFILENSISLGWRFLKFRHLRYLIDSPTLNRDNFEIELEMDPLTESPAQLRLL